MGDRGKAWFVVRVALYKSSARANLYKSRVCVGVVTPLACVSGLCFIEWAADFRISGQSVFSRSHVMNTDLETKGREGCRRCTQPEAWRMVGLGGGLT